MPPPPPCRHYRRCYLTQAGSDSSEASSGAAASTYVTAPSVLTPVPESPAVYEADENSSASVSAASSTAKTGPRAAAAGLGCAAPTGLAPANNNRWRRKNAAERQEAERRQHLAEMRAYFEEASSRLMVLRCGVLGSREQRCCGRWPGR